MKIGRFTFVAAALLVVTACGSPANDASKSPTNSATPSSSVSVSPTPSTSPSEVKVAAIYFVGDTAQGLRLYREFHTIPVELGSSIGLASLKYVVAQGTKALDQDYINLWGNGSSINSITQVGSTATVDLSIAHLNVGAEAEIRAIDQLVWTLTANDKTIHTVRFVSDGVPLESFAGHVDATGTFERESTFDVVAPLWVDAPISPLRNPVTFTGTACTFEAGVAWTLTQSGSVVKTGSTTAAQACPVRSAWSVQLGTLKAGDYVFTAIDYSAQDGSIDQQDSKAFTVK